MPDTIRSSEPRGTLYVVGTPIGNLDDLTPRAVSALAESDLVACEDTRRTRVILSRHGLAKRTVSCHRHNETRRLPQLLLELRRGSRVALVTDGGTPGLSDPGALLVRAARLEGHRVVPVPGASALTALLSVSGFDPGPFTFIGFLPPRQGERRRALQALRSEPRPLVFFESPRRLVTMLADALEALGDREAVLGREMTKVHEEFVAGTLGSIRASFAGRPLKGEIALLVAGAPADAAARELPAGGALPRESIAARVRRHTEAGLARKEAMRRVARETGLSRRDVYRDMLREREDEE
ncbi:MAG TPA: 16S rRNA (cytidine(1402)-2'-O)-methyltransferase [Candidatus Polarisedimenticolia bacterium]|nr:16S rRNA (cytidine(1402)-2'-O)-methyltransferase [Candidatus Polarisedimenticolia bacterium]